MTQPRDGASPASYLVAALGLAACAALWATGPAKPHGAWAPAFLRGYAIAWACYVLAAVIVSRSRSFPRWALLSVVVLAMAMRLVALERTHPLSTDAYRYLWDGRVANAGINPFSHAPDSRELQPLRDENWRKISFKGIPTIYPPLAQLLFAGLARVKTSEIDAFRWTFALFDIGTVFVLMALLRRTGRPPEQAIWYAWCPLAVTEVTAGAHVDALGLFLLMLALLLISRETRAGAVGSGVALAGAVMTKGYAVLALPFFIRRGGWRLALAFVLACLALAAPFAHAGADLVAGLRAYVGSWKANAGVFSLLDHVLARVTNHHFGVARAVTSGAVVLLVAVLAGRLRPSVESLLRATLLAFGAQLLLGAPTLPWYAIWIVPALCWWGVPGLALFTLTVSAQYYARWLHPGDTAAHHALLWAGYLPVYALLIGQLIWWRMVARSRKAASAAA